MISGIHLATALSVMLHMEQEGNGMEASKRNLNAYYFGFDVTGDDCVDAILEAVADAGHSSHHTESWSDGEFGESLADAIQRAAQKAADRLSEQQQVIDALASRLEFISLALTDHGYSDYGPMKEAVTSALSLAKNHTKDAK